MDAPCGSSAGGDHVLTPDQVSGGQKAGYCRGSGAMESQQKASTSVREGSPPVYQRVSRLVTDRTAREITLNSPVPFF